MNVIANYIFQINYGLLQNKNRTNLETFFGRFFGAVGGIGIGGSAIITLPDCLVEFLSTNSVETVK